MCAMVLLAYHSVITYYLGKNADKRKYKSYWLAAIRGFSSLYALQAYGFKE